MNENDATVRQIMANLSEVRARIDAAAEAAGRSGREVSLIAVSKMQPPERILAALAAGQRVFGENRIQEARARWSDPRRRHDDLELHLIGPLQTNKVADAIALFDVLQTIDRPKLAMAVAKEMEKQGRRPSCFIQINTGEEPQKAGIPPREADPFIEACRSEYRLPVVGLMCIPPANDEPSTHFALLGEIAKRHGLKRLSMGMSADYEIAVEFGATEVRVGTAIFGERNKPTD